MQSCREGTSPEAAATFTGRWAGKPWAGDASALLIAGGASGDTLYIFGARPPGAGLIPDQTISVRVIANGPGTYVLGADAIVVTDLVGGDVMTSRYGGSGESAGTLTILEHAGPGGIVRGTLAFSARPAGAAAPYGPLARFEDGEFRATIVRAGEP